MIVIGTDPSFRYNGMAIFIFNTETKEVETRIFKNLRSFQKWIDGLEDEKPPQTAIVGVEDGSAQGIYEGNFQAFLKKCKAKDSRGMRNSYAINVGKNMAATKYAISLFSEKYKPRNVFSITPKQKGVKMSARSFETTYGIKTIDYTQDEIDAGVIAMVAFHQFKFAQKIKQAK